MTGLLDRRFGLKRALLLGVVLASALATSQVRAAAQSFAALSEQLSEPNGDFDTDNLISNESRRSVLSRVVSPAAYIGVGPDQNSHRALFGLGVIDIRRDNPAAPSVQSALQRVAQPHEHLSLLTGRAAPDRRVMRDANHHTVCT
jgi:hypothetical protein